MQPTVSQAQSGPSAGRSRPHSWNVLVPVPRENRTGPGTDLGLKESPVMKLRGMKRTRTRMHVLTHTHASACHTGEPEQVAGRTRVRFPGDPIL